MRTIYEAKSLINNNKGNKVWLTVKGVRNKKEIVEGIIIECYRNIFIVKTIMGNKSFSYSDLLIGNVRMNVN